MEFTNGDQVSDVVLGFGDGLSGGSVGTIVTCRQSKSTSFELKT
jgi:hypothetical protein